MCGRFILSADAEAIREHFRVTGQFRHQPRYNIAPSQPVPVVTGSPEKRKITYMQWGLIPQWVKEAGAGYKMINARSETIGQKPAFRDSLRRRRCLVPADGFYEWKKTGGGKKPFFISLPGRKLFAFAGIWDRWVAPEGEEILTCSIITVGANEFMGEIHDRMPVILACSEQYHSWLLAGGGSLLTPYCGPMEARPVSALVNSPGREGAELIKPG